MPGRLSLRPDLFPFPFPLLKRLPSATTGDDARCRKSGADCSTVKERMLDFRFKKLLALPLCLLLLQHSTVFSQTSAPPEPLKALDAYVEKGLSDWRIPGLAIAVVKDDKVIFAR